MKYRVLIIMAATAVFSTWTAEATELRSTPFTYEYGVARDYSSDQEHVICDSCETGNRLTAALKLPTLTARFSQAASLPVVTVSPMAISETLEKGSSVVTNPQTEKLVSVHFLINDYRLLPQEQQTLVKAVPLIKNRLSEGVNVKISGYTCDLGTKEYNNSLALKRATTVAKFLEKQGVKLTSADGTGKCCYVSENDREANRRAEITLWSEKVNE